MNIDWIFGKDFDWFLGKIIEGLTYLIIYKIGVKHGINHSAKVIHKLLKEESNNKD